MIDREAIKKRMLAVAWENGGPLLDDAVSVALDLLREFGHRAGCECHEYGGPNKADFYCGQTLRRGLCPDRRKQHPYRDSRCFQQSPAKEKA